MPCERSQFRSPGVKPWDGCWDIPNCLRSCCRWSITSIAWGNITYLLHGDEMQYKGETFSYLEHNVMSSQQIKSGKSFISTLLLCLLVGWLGVHRFYVGKTKTGILMLLTMGGLGIWQLIDVIFIATQTFKDSDGLPIKT
jgi:TM2 domain-containing membrane protein YozV